MEDHVKLLCQELMAELAKTALDNCEMSPAPVESFLQANIVAKGAAQLHQLWIPMLPVPLR